MACNDADCMSEAPTEYDSEGCLTVPSTSDPPSDDEPAVTSAGTVRRPLQARTSNLLARRNRTLNITSLDCQRAHGVKMPLEHECNDAGCMSEAPTEDVSEGCLTVSSTSDPPSDDAPAVTSAGTVRRPLQARTSNLLARRHRTLNVTSLDCQRAHGVKMPLELEPEILERYEIKNVLGAGQISTVYRASLRNNSEKEVAVKVLKDCADSDAAHVARQEFEILKLLPPHPHIIQTVDFHELCTNGPALVLEFFDGHTLHELVSAASQKRLPEASACVIGFALFQAVAHLHANQVIHRDIKPQNIFATPSLSDIRLADFNVAKHLGIYESFTPVGDFLHRAPEVLSGDAPSKSSDVWSSGLSVFFALSGDSPQYRRLRRPATKARLLDIQDSCWDLVPNAMKTSLSAALSHQPSSRPNASQLCTEGAWFGNVSSYEDAGR